MSQFPDHGIDWVLNVTGLSPQQLLPILKRLNELGLIDGERLSSEVSYLLFGNANCMVKQGKYGWMGIIGTPSTLVIPA